MGGPSAWAWAGERGGGEGGREDGYVPMAHFGHIPSGSLVFLCLHVNYEDLKDEAHSSGPSGVPPIVRNCRAGATCDLVVREAGLVPSSVVVALSGVAPESDVIRSSSGFQSSSQSLAFSFRFNFRLWLFGTRT